MADYKVNENYKRTPENIVYTDMMVREKKTDQKRPVSTVQCASTQILQMNDEDLRQHYIDNPLDLSKAIAEHPDKVARRIDPYEHAVYEGMRRGAKNQTGMSEKSATTKEKRQKAEDAYQFTPPAPLSEVQLERVTKLNRIKEIERINGLIKDYSKPTILERIGKFFNKKEDPRGPRLTKEFLDEWTISKPGDKK